MNPRDPDMCVVCGDDETMLWTADGWMCEKHAAEWNDDLKLMRALGK